MGGGISLQQMEMCVFIVLCFCQNIRPSVCTYTGIPTSFAKLEPGDAFAKFPTFDLYLSLVSHKLNFNFERTVNVK